MFQTIRSASRNGSRSTYAAHAVRRFIFCPVFWGFLAGFIIGEAFGDDTVPCDAEASSKIPIEIDDFIFLPVEVFGDRFRFLLDTGCSKSMFDEGFRKQLGPVATRDRVLTANGILVMEFFAAPEMKIGTDPQFLFRSNKPVGCLDLSSVKDALNVKNFGAVGMDFLLSKILRLNFDDGVAEIAHTPSLKSSHCERLHFVLDMPYMLLRLPNEGFKRFLIDTGANGNSLVLDTALFQRMLKKRKLVLLDEEITIAADGATPKRFGILDCIEFGPHRFFNVVVHEGSVNAIQLPFLQKFDVEFDFPNALGRFKPGKLIDVADRRNRAKMGVDRVGQRVVVADTDPTGIGGTAGLRDGDCLIHVNGTAADRFTLREIRNLLSRPGTKVQLTYERDGVSKDVILDLPDEPDPFPAKSPHELIEARAEFDK